MLMQELEDQRDHRFSLLGRRQDVTAPPHMFPPWRRSGKRSCPPPPPADGVDVSCFYTTVTLPSGPLRLKVEALPPSLNPAARFERTCSQATNSISHDACSFCNSHGGDSNRFQRGVFSLRNAPEMNMKYKKRCSTKQI